MKDTMVKLLRASRAEILYCLDVLVRHISDENAMDAWLSLGVPDGTLKDWPTDEQLEPYLAYVDDTESYEGIVRTGVTLLKKAALRTKTTYVKGSLE